MQPFSKDKKNIPIILRWILGTIFILSGVSAVITTLPLPEFSNEGSQFIAALKESNYLFITVKTIETLCGLMLIFNFFVPFALVLVAPIVLNIVMFGIFLSPSTLPIALAVAALHLALVWQYRSLFKLFFKYQTYSHPLQEETAHIVILEELKERYPHKFDDIRPEEMAKIYVDHKQPPVHENSHGRGA